MSHKLLGNPDVIEQPREYSGGPNKPNILIRTFKGAKAKVLAQLSSIILAGYEWNVKEEGPNATLRFQTPILDAGGGADTEQPVNTWELLPGKHEKGILEADLDGSNGSINMANVTAAEKKIILAAIQNVEDDPSLAADANEIYQLMRNDVRSRIQIAPVLRHTQTVSSSYTVQQANTNAERILSTAKVLADEGVPNSFLIVLNSAPYTNVSNRTADPVLIWGWYKDPPTLNAAASSGQLQIVQEFHFGLWSVGLYKTLVT